MPQRKKFRYSLNQRIRDVTKRIMRSVTIKSKEEEFDLHKEEVKRILLVRANFRMGDLILATPAISVFRKRFPHARIDFVGSAVSETLFRSLPVDHHFCITRRFPHCSWAYLVLVKQLRSVAYDLALDVSCSQSAMGSFIVGFSKARFRVGVQGEWDRWFNVRIPRPAEKNKYKALLAFLRSLGLESREVLPSLALSSVEKEQGRKRIAGLVEHAGRPTVAVFVGGRKTWGKRWPVKNFCQLIASLYCRGVNVVTFFGPEERDRIGFFRDAFDPGIPLVFEASCRAFAAMVSNCDLFVTCDSGPMHLSCSLGIRTVAIFQKHNFDHWGPPPALARIVYQPGGPSVEEVLKGCLAELAQRFAHFAEFCREGLLNASPLTALPNVAKVTRRLEMSLFTQKLLLLSRCSQALSLLTLIIYTWFFPHSGLFAEGTWLDAFTDMIGIASVVAGGCLRIWAASYLGAWSGQQRLKIPALVTRGPYAYIRHPLYMANCIIGFGIIFLLDAFSVMPLFIALAFLLHITVIPAEEALLKEKLGGEFELYRYLVPRYVPTAMPRLQDFSVGAFFSLKEVGALSGILLVACFFDWMQDPVNRNWFLTSYAWFANKIFL